MNWQVERKKESVFLKNRFMACETLCQKIKVNIIKIQKNLKKTGNLLLWQFSKLREYRKQGSWQMQISAVSLLSSPWRQLPDLGNWVRQMLPPVGYNNSCLLRDLWWPSQERRRLQNAVWKRHCSCITTITKTKKPRTHLGKSEPLWFSTAEWQRKQWKNPPSCTVTHALQELPQKFSIKSSGIECKEETFQNYLEAITSVLLIISFINVFISVLMSVICYSGCIPLLIMGMSVFYFTKNAFLPYSPNYPL